MRRRAWALASLVATIAFAAYAGPAAAQAPPQQCPVVVDNTTLKADCLAPMVIAGNDLTVNLGTHQVICSPASGEGIIINGRTDVRITNGHVHGCSGLNEIGLSVRGGGSHHFSNLHLDGNDNSIRIADGSVGNHLSGIYSSGNRIGVNINNSHHNRLDAGMVIVDNSNLGVLFQQGASGNLVTSSRIGGASSQGVFFGTGTSDNTVRSSSIEGPGAGTGLGTGGAAGSEIVSNRISGWTNGVRVSTAATGTQIGHNVIHGNTTNGILQINGSSQSRVFSNSVFENGIGIHLSVGSTANLIEHNRATDNVVFDLEDDNPNCDANVWLNNNFNTTNQPQCVD
jgi:parallel beta-helix repeat protein